MPGAHRDMGGGAIGVESGQGALLVNLKHKNKNVTSTGRETHSQVVNNGNQARSKRSLSERRQPNSLDTFIGDRLCQRG